ncbi:MAG: cell division protein ZapA [bacterium]|nr:cell division protein ZapA [Gammaproteobacteria bacterium]HIL94435.1 cell division protein ZapA [Pseudomonadales bacterium]
MTADIETVTVSILEKDYQVTCEPDEVSALKKSAEYVDIKMRDVKSNASILGLDRIAVMAALNIANDYLEQSQSNSDVIETQINEIQTLSTKLEQTINRLKAEKR